MNYNIPINDRLAMYLRGTPVRKIKRELKRAEKHSLAISHTDFEAHFLADGDIADLTDSIIFAKDNGIRMSFETAAAGQFIAMHQEGTSLLEKLQIMKEEGIEDAEPFIAPDTPSFEVSNEEKEIAVEEFLAEQRQESRKKIRIPTLLAAAFGGYIIVAQKIRLKGYTYEGIDAVVLGSGIVAAAIGLNIYVSHYSWISENKRKTISYLCAFTFIASFTFAIARNV